MVLQKDFTRNVTLSSIFEAEIGFVLTDYEGYIAIVNPWFCRTTGFSESQLIGKAYQSLLAHEVLQAEHLQNRLLWENGEKYSIQIKHLKKDGTYADLHATSQLINHEGNTLKFTIYQDVTESVRQVDLMGKVGDQVKVGGWLRDLTTESIIWTKGIFDIYEIPQGEIPRFGDEELLRFFTKEGLAKIIHSHDFTRTTGRRSEVIIPFTSASGKKKWIKNTTDAQIINGEITGLYGTFQDITEEKNRELQIEHSGKFYKYLFDESPNALLLVQNFGRYEILDVNRAAEKMYGYNHTELTHKSIFDLQPDSELLAFDEVIKETDQNRTYTSTNNPVTHIKKDGSHIKVQVYWNVLVIDGKEMRLVHANNVTQSIENKRKLESINAVLSTLIQSSPIAIITLDPMGKVQLYNPKAEEILGWKAEEVLGNRLPYVKGPDIERFDRYFNESLESEEAYVLELERPNKNGKLLNLRVYVTPLFDENQKVETVMLLIEDITEEVRARTALVDSEKNYRNLVEASSDLIWKQDIVGNITFVNKTSEKVLGFEPNEMLGEPFHKFVLNEAQREYETMISREVSKGGVSENYDLKMVDKKNQVVHLAATIYPIYDVFGEVIGCSGSAGDLTHIIKYQRHLEQSLKEKEILIKEIHHRVKNNLSVLSGLFTLQAMNIDDEGMKQIFMESQMRIKSIASIHEKLYQNELFSSIEVKEYLQQMIQDIKSTNAKPGNDIQIEVMGDEVVLNMNQAVPFGILANEMIINAYKYAFEDLETGFIRLSMVKNEGEFIFTVEDNGIGLPKDFDAMSQKSLGMTLIHSLTQQLDGKLEIFTGEGTSFRLRFNPEQ